MTLRTEDIAADAALPDTAEETGFSDADDAFALQVTQPGQGGGILLIAAAGPEQPEDSLKDVAADELSPAHAADGWESRPETTAREAEKSMEDAPAGDTRADVAGVRLRPLGPVNFFLTRGRTYAEGDMVMVDMEGSLALGKVVSTTRVDPSHLVMEEGGKLRPVVRKVDDLEAAAAADNISLAEEAVRFCKQCIRERALEMKLVDVLIMHDRSKMIFYFTAPARIDFRDLVKDLVRKYRTRIELRQIGVRHETQMAGAIGNCGMVCCCRRYLRRFAPVAIKMAKEQNVFLNPAKISGICGRLLCCLAYEQDHYDEFYRRCPKLGKKYQTDKGVVRVLRASLFRESVSVLNENNEENEYTLAEWKTLNPHRPDASQQHAQGGRDGGAKREEGDRDRPHERSRGGAAAAAGGNASAGRAVSPVVLSDGETSSRAVWPKASPVTQFVPNAGIPADLEPSDDDNSDSIFGLAPHKTAPAEGASGLRPPGSGGHRRHRRK